MKKLIFTLVLGLMASFAFGQLSKDATTDFTTVYGNWRSGHSYVVEVSDTLTDAENDTILYNCIRAAKIVSVKALGAELTGTLAFNVRVYASPTRVVADIDYANAVIGSMAGADAAWTDTVSIPTLAGVQSNIGPCSIVIDGAGTQSSTYRVIVTESVLSKR